MTDKQTTEPAGKQEYRVVTSDGIELRAAADGGPGTLTGYAAKFNKDSVDLGWFIERIRPGAFDSALKTSDVRALVNHDPNQIIGRTPQTLRLDTNKTGLRFEIDLPDTQPGRDIAESVKRGDISGCSFAFTTEKDEWEYTEVGPDRREIVEVKELFDVGPVSYPAYPDTTVAARAMAQARGTLPEPLAEPEPEPEPTDLEKLVAQLADERRRARLKRRLDYNAKAVAKADSDDELTNDKE